VWNTDRKYGDCEDDSDSGVEDIDGSDDDFEDEVMSDQEANDSGYEED